MPFAFELLLDRYEGFHDELLKSKFEFPHLDRFLSGVLSSEDGVAVVLGFDIAFVVDPVNPLDRPCQAEFLGY